MKTQFSITLPSAERSKRCLKQQRSLSFTLLATRSYTVLPQLIRALRAIPKKFHPVYYVDEDTPCIK